MYGHEMGTHILWVARKVVSYSGKHFENHINNHNTFHTFNPQISAIHCRITYIGGKKKELDLDCTNLKYPYVKNGILRLKGKPKPGKKIFSAYITERLMPSCVKLSYQ